MHEGMQVAVREPALNDRVGSAGVHLPDVVFRDRVMHLRHHRYLGDPRDPDDIRTTTEPAYRVVLPFRGSP
jgi:fatty acid desaturase